jgi:hypothetical protein
MTNPIVTVNVSEVIAPTPSKLQKTGAFVSQGGTTKASGTRTLITQKSDLTAIIKAAIANTSLTWSGNVVTVTSSAAHGYANATQFWVVISGVTPSGYNGTFLATVTGANTFTYARTGDPGAETIPGTWQTLSAVELTAMGNTFFAQGASQAVYVLELGIGNDANGVTALSSYIDENSGFFYSYLVPSKWSSESTYLTFLADFESTTAKTYFFTTVTAGNYTSFTALMKCVFAVLPAPAAPVTEFTAAAAFWVTLHYNPSATNKVTPTAFSYVFGVTAYPTAGNQTLITALQAAFINIVGNGAEGGVSNNILLWGTTKDGNDFTYWYSVDWVQVNVDLAISNAVINGSNNPVNPLYYNQAGIDRLQGVAAQTMTNGVSFGLVLGQIIQTALDGPDLDDQFNDGNFDNQTVVNAIPFVSYSKENTGDYAAGRYAGFTIIYTPARGFISIVFNVIVTQFVAQ